MKKYLSYIAFAMMAVSSLAFVSCGDDDDEGPSTSGGLLVINGKSYNISFKQTGVVWVEPPFNSVIQFCTGKNGILSEEGETYTFGFPAWDGKKYVEPTVGMDVTKFKYEISEIGETISSFTLDDDNDNEFDYVSGSLVITEVNESQESITLKFNSLKMGNGESSHTFNGTIKLPF